MTALLAVAIAAGVLTLAAMGVAFTNHLRYLRQQRHKWDTRRRVQYVGGSRSPIHDEEWRP